MKIGVICAPGGHLVQALAVIEAFKEHEVFLVTYDSDALAGFESPLVKKTYLIKFYGATPLRIIQNLLFSIPVLMKIFSEEKPKILFSTGSEIAIPAFYMGKFFYGMKVVFLETFVRSKIPTLTAKAVYPISDFFLVQWEHMIRKIGPRTRYVGNIL